MPLIFMDFAKMDSIEKLWEAQCREESKGPRTNEGLELATGEDFDIELLKRMRSETAEKKGQKRKK